MWWLDFDTQIRIEETWTYYTTLLILTDTQIQLGKWAYYITMLASQNQIKMTYSWVHPIGEPLSSPTNRIIVKEAFSWISPFLGGHEDRPMYA